MMGSMFRGGSLGCILALVVCGLVLNAAPVFAKNYIYYLDADGDDFGDPANSVKDRVPPPGYVSNNLDCNDADPSIYPNAPEICGDGIDQSCDGEDVVCTTTWERTFGGLGYEDSWSLHETFEGDFLLSGGPVLYKVDLLGNPIWNQSYTADCSFVEREAVDTFDGGVVVVGQFNNGCTGNYDVLMIKADAQGNEEWRRVFGGPGFDQGFSIEQLDDGGYIILGAGSPLGTETAMYLIRTNSAGNELWSRTFLGQGTARGLHLKITSDGGFILVGSTYYAPQNNNNYFLVKTDSAGNEIWSRTYGGNGGDWPYDVEELVDGGFILVGETYSFGVGNAQIYVIRTDALGNEIWSQLYGGDGTEFGNSIEQTDDGGFIIGGSTNSFGVGSRDLYVVKTDDLGNEQWYRTYGGISDDRGTRIVRLSDGGFVFLGDTASYGAGSYDLYLLRTDSLGFVE